MIRLLLATLVPLVQSLTEPLPASYDRLEAWLGVQALQPRGGFWEIYWTDPGLEPDPSTWRTQLYWPVE